MFQSSFTKTIGAFMSMSWKWESRKSWCYLMFEYYKKLKGKMNFAGLTLHFSSLSRILILSGKVEMRIASLLKLTRKEKKKNHSVDIDWLAKASYRKKVTLYQFHRLLLLTLAFNRLQLNLITTMIMIPMNKISIFFDLLHVRGNDRTV